MKKRNGIRILISVALAAVCLCAASLALALEDNTLTCTVDGTETTFYLSSAELTSDRKYMVATYLGFTPRGDEAGKLRLVINSSLGTGTYDSTASNQDILIRYSDPNQGCHLYATNGLLERISDTRAGDTYVPYAMRLAPKEAVGAYALRIDSRSDDWSSYTGVFVADVDAMYGNIYVPVSIKDGRFSFTLGQSHAMATGGASSGDSLAGDLPGEEPAQPKASDAPSLTDELPLP